MTPPYFLIAVGLFVSLTSGLAFFVSLQEQMQFWSRDLTPDQLTRWAKLQLFIPFGGTAAGVWITLTALLITLGVPGLTSWAAALLLTTLASSFVWTTIGQKMGQRIIRSYLAQQL